jgi:hypothetical protein
MALGGVVAAVTVRATIVLLSSIAACAGSTGPAGVAPTAPTAAAVAGAATVRERFPVPQGFERVTSDSSSFSSWLQRARLKPEGSAVRLYNGALKARQDVHAAVLDLSVGHRDLQQCADAVMRLRAEYLYASGRQDAIAFHFTNGFLAEWKRWRDGERIDVTGNTCRWRRLAEPDASHAELLRFLEIVFTYAGTLSLAEELAAQTPADLPAEDLRPGDVFIQGGSPGHAVIVMDVAHGTDGRTAFLLAQSYMPAQEVHVLNDLAEPSLGAWFILGGGDRLRTPEWTFDWSDRRRFAEPEAGQAAEPARR